MNLQLMKRSLAQCAHSPSVDGGGIAMGNPMGFGLDGRAVTRTEVRNSNPSGVRESNRVSNWVFRMVAILAVLLNGSMFSYSQSEAPLELNLKDCQPCEDGRVSSISEFVFSFDFEKVYATYPDVDKADFGICTSMGEEKYITVYRGDAEEGNILCTINQSISTRSKLFAPGETSLKLSLDQTYVLEPNQKYTVSIPPRVFYTRTKASAYDTYASEYQYVFYGEEDAGEELLLLEENPKRGSVINNLSVVQLDFNHAISFDSNLIVTITEEGNSIAEGRLERDSEREDRVLLKFSDAPLYNGHTYVINLPANIIFIKDTGIGNPEISLNYKGGEYKYLSYGRISPSNNSEISYFSTILVPIVKENNLILGRAKAPKVYVFEGDSEVPVQSCIAEKGEDGNSWILPIWNFELKEAQNYRVEIPADQYHLWYVNELGNMVEAVDVSNPELVLTYTTPDLLTPPAKVTIEATRPADLAKCDRIEEIVITFAPYELDDSSYPIYSTSENPIAIFSDGVTKTDVPISFRNGTEEATITLNRPLEPEKEYTLTIPANTFVPHANENLMAVAGNEEKILTFVGSKLESFTVSCNYGDAITISNVVNRGEATTLTFNPSEEWSIKSVLVNNEEQDVENNELVLSDVTEDTDVYVTYKYDGICSFDFTTDVANIAVDCPYDVTVEPGKVIIDGIVAGATVEVYNTVGMQMATATATDTRLSLTVNPGIVVIVVREPDQQPVGLTLRIPA